MQRILLLSTNKTVDTKTFKQNLTFRYCPRRTFSGSETQRRKKVTWTADVSSKRKLPNSGTNSSNCWHLGTCRVAKYDRLPAAGHFHLPARQFVAARRSTRCHLCSERKRHRADGEHFYFIQGFSRFLFRTYQLIQG